ncbi:MAG: hypothetical protein KC549_08505 [Myxococcales bacterium]|nr:hypothetical protein [Myxococcales bacterium]MCB9548040.1 hypothetical protein [Myxococcales bacterium]
MLTAFGLWLAFALIPQVIMPTPPPEAPASSPAPSAPGLTLVQQQIDDARLAALVAEGRLTPAVVEVDLSSNQITAAGVATLLASPIEKLQLLVLYDNRIGDAGAQALGRAPKLAGVNHLDVAYNGLTAPGVTALVGPGTVLTGPTYLSVAGNALPDAWLDALAAGPFVPHLRDLSLRRTGLTDAGAQRLAGLPFAKLERLNVSGNALSPAGRAALQAAPWARRCRITYD